MTQGKKTAKAPAADRVARLRLLAKTAGLSLEKQGPGYQVVDSLTGTQVAASWTDDGGLTLEQIETALSNN